MPLWDQAVDILRGSILVYAQASNSNLAAGIMAVTFLARLALFPLTVRLARIGASHQAAMTRIQPQLESLRKQFKNDPRRLADETRRLFAREGVSMVPVAGCLGGVAQVPVLLALFSAVRQASEMGGRFLWVRDISRPDAILTILVTLLTLGGLMAGPQPSADQKWMLLAVTTVISVVSLSQMAAGVGVYWGVSSAVGIAQGVIVRRQLARMAA
jgi:YidC/Oxa1 family membrane protein insertase